MASSEILTPHPLTTRRVCTPQPLVWGEDTLAGWVETGWGVNSSEDARHCYVLYIQCKYFVGTRLRHNPDLLAFIPYNLEPSNPVGALRDPPYTGSNITA
jgi:hypothetical protein